MTSAFLQWEEPQQSLYIVEAFYLINLSFKLATISYIHSSYLKVGFVELCILLSALYVCSWCYSCTPARYYKILQMNYVL